MTYLPLTVCVCLFISQTLSLLFCNFITSLYIFYTHTAIKYCLDKIFKSLYFHMSLTSILSPFSQGCQYTVSNAVSAVLRALTLREEPFLFHTKWLNIQVCINRSLSLLSLKTVLLLECGGFSRLSW